MPKTKEPSPPALKHVRFAVRLPGAEKVAITGDFINWDPEGIPLHHAGIGEWYVALGLAPGVHEYRLRVDGEWRDDPDSVRRVPNPFGTENSVLVVSR